jgi:hypothetical protein
MRKLLGVLVGCGLIAATIVPSFACEYKTNASTESSQSQQTAQAQTSQHTE